MMAEIDATIIAEKFGYTFEVRDWLRLALTAAGAEENNHDGNRKLAEMGDDVMQLAIHERGFEGAEPQDRLKGLSAILKSKERRASAARLAGIDCHIKLCERARGVPSTGTLSLTMSAIVGAVWKDSNSLSAVWQVLSHLAELCSVESTTREPESAQRADPEVITRSNGQGGRTVTNPEHAINVVAPLVTEEIATEIDLMISANASAARTSDLTNGTDEVRADELYPNTASEMFPTTPTSLIHSYDEPMDYVLTNIEENIATLSQPVLGEQPVTDSLLEGWLSIDEESSNQESSATRSLPPASTNSWSRFSSEAPQDPSDIDQRPSTIQQILDGICSPGSLVTLRDIVRGWREQASFVPPSPLGELTARDRLSAISGIEQQTALLTLLRWAHVLQLYIKYPDYPGQGDKFIAIEFSQAVIPSRVGQAGNPLIGSKSDATRRLMSDAFPNLPPGSLEYKREYRKATQLRKLGRRLRALTTVGGEAVLGLLQNRCAGQGSSQPLSITDRMLLALNDDAYDEFIKLLDKYHGKQLRAFSAAVAPLVDGLVSQTLGETDSLALERLDQDRIMEHTRFSPELLRLISA